MLDVTILREKPEYIKEKIALKKINPKLVDDFLAIDGRWRESVKQTDELRAWLNQLSKERKIAAPNGGEPRQAEGWRDEAKKVKEELKKAEGELPNLETQRGEILNRLPNLPEDGWLAGRDESENKVLREIGERPKFKFPIKDYFELGQSLGLIDTERAAKVAGSRFGYILKELVLLEFALVQFAFNKLIKKGFIPILPPQMIRPNMFKGMGRLTGGQEEERYYLSKDDLYLIGSAEHTIGPFHANETLDAEKLPIRYAGFSTCFRREAGSYGKDTKGILRVHQFDKVEMFSFSKPEESKKEHDFLLSLQEEMMQELELPYRVVQICTGDMGWTDAAQYDIETWLPGQNQYRETHSCSNTTDFQSHGLNIKVSSEGGSASGGKNKNLKAKSEYAHLLNATAFAIGRTLIAVIENFQNKDGSITVPKALRKHSGLKKIASR